MKEIVLKKEIIVNKTLCRLIGVSVFVILTSLGAFVRIPLRFSPVPITLQTLFVLLSAASLGKNLGVLTQLSYIALGISGLPIFAGAGCGLLYLFGPTGGYLLGFVLASFFIGRFIKYAQDNFFYIFAILCLGDFIILSCGVVWLKIILRYPLLKLLYIGFAPFIIGDLLKAFVASVIYLKLKKRTEEIF